MADFIDAGKYGSLGDMSDGSYEQKEQTFKTVFITGQPRENQTPGTMACMVDFDANKYLFSKRDTLYIIPLYVKKICEAYRKMPGKDYDKLVYFSWNGVKPEDNPDAKVGYIIAGMLLDENKKAVKIDDPENEGKKIQAVVALKCNGIKVGGVIQYLNDLNKKNSELEPLSNDPQFNRNVIAPRRFITKVTVTTADSSHGKKYVFKIVPEQSLPKESVLEIMNMSTQYSEKFVTQFNRTDSVTQSTQQTSSAVVSEGSDVSFSDSPQTSAMDDLPKIDLGL